MKSRINYKTIMTIMSEFVFVCLFVKSHFSVNACLAPICSVHGMAVTTVEGIGNTKTKLHPVQVCKIYQTN